MTKAEIYEQISRDYEKDRDNAYFLGAQRKKEIYEIIPEIEAIDEEIRASGCSVARTMLSPGSREEKQNRVKNLKDKNLKLAEQKKLLLEEKGYNRDYLENVHKCSICKDTGMVDNKRCGCFIKKLIGYAYDMSSLADKLQYENFDTFDFSFYSSEPFENEKLAPIDNIKRIYAACQKFSLVCGVNFNNLLMYGSCGLGKTFLCNCIAKDVLDRGLIVIYRTASQLFKAIENEKFGKQGNEASSSDFLDLLMDVDLLIIDDLGTEFQTILSASELYNIINNRIFQKKSTVISTNLDPIQLSRIYSDRIMSRIYGNYMTLKFYGEDIRLLKRRKNWD